MLAKILGAIWIISGLIWMIKPYALKNRLQKKSNRKLKLIVYFFIIAFGFLIIVSVIKAEGLLPKIVGVLGLLLVIKGILLVTSRTSEKMLNWLAEKPVHFFRIMAFLVCIIGIMLILS